MRVAHAAGIRHGDVPESSEEISLVATFVCYHIRITGNRSSFCLGKPWRIPLSHGGTSFFWRDM